MLLAFSIGNTDIAFCVWKSDAILFRASLSTQTARTADEYAILFHQTFLMHNFDARLVTDVIIASVVPLLDDTIRSAVAHFTDARPMFVGAGMKTGLKIRIDTPSQLGADLVALAVASKQYTNGACIIATFDTATTLTCLDTEGALTGAVIMPGLMSSVRALERDAAQLTEFSLSPPRRVIGKNTAESMQSGLLIGAAAQTDGMVTRILKELGCTQKDITLLGTGKYASYIIPHCEYRPKAVPDLLFEGLYHLYQRMQQMRSRG